MASNAIQSARDRLEGSPVKGERLTPRQSEILTYILQCWLSGFLPTVREIAKEFGVASTNTVAGHLRGLEERGYLDTEPNRGMVLTDKAIDLAMGNK